VEAEQHLFDIPSVLWWIEKRKPANTRLTAQQAEISEAVLPNQAEEWLHGQDEDDS